MSRKARRKEEEKGAGSASITSFLYGTEETAKAESKTTAKEKETTQMPRAEEVTKEVSKTATPAITTGIEDEVLKHIMSRGSITKDELMAWAKTRGYKVADILRAIEALTGRGRIKKRLNDKGNLIYVYVK